MHSLHYVLFAFNQIETGETYGALLKDDVLNVREIYGTPKGNSPQWKPMGIIGNIFVRTEILKVCSGLK
jgi:hypothetical protein